jgi:hypothetical protein
MLFCFGAMREGGLPDGLAAALELMAGLQLRLRRVLLPPPPPATPEVNGC